MDVFEKVKETRPVIHILTNYVTARDVVNIVLAAGASGICADAPEEAAEITAISKGLLINIGTPSVRKARTLVLSGKQANKSSIPVVLDPVGLGASEFRKKIVSDLLDNVYFACIKGNMSEMASIARIAGIPLEKEEAASQGVETSGEDVPVVALQKLAEKYDTVIVVTGVKDYIVDKDRVWISETGTKLQRRVTGSGCMLSGFLTAVLSCADDYGQAAHVAVERFGEAAKEAEEEMRASGHLGTGTFVTYLIDAVSRIPGL